MMNKRVEGSYDRVDDAIAAVDRLRNQGYNRNSITLVANQRVKETIPFMTDAEVTTDMDTDITDTTRDDDRSIWEKIKDAFTMDDYDTTNYHDSNYDSSNDPLHNYRDDINKGNILVLIDDDAAKDTDMVDRVVDPLAGTPHDPTLEPGPEAPIIDPTLDRSTKSTDPLLRDDMDPTLDRKEDFNRPL